MDEALYRLHAEREETYWWWVAKNRIILRLIERFAPPRQPGVAARALDIGCGAGGVLSALSRGYEAVGVDMSPVARAYCHRRGLTALEGSLPADLPAFEPGSMDVIVMSEVVEHVQDDRGSIDAAVRLLRPGGIMVCTVPAHRWLWTSHDDFNQHVRRYARREFGALFDGLGVTRLVLSYFQAAALPLVVGARLGERVRTRLTGKAPTEPSVRPLPGAINTALRAAFESEKFILPVCRLPWGTSIVSVHRRQRG